MKILDRKKKVEAEMRRENLAKKGQKEKGIENGNRRKKKEEKGMIDGKYSDLFVSTCTLHVYNTVLIRNYRSRNTVKFECGWN